jgi:formiminotetrahydrofolate cyclodeaminase
MSLYEKTLNEFLAEASSSSPTPGGGSVSAVVGTHAAAMVCMVANLTIGKKKYLEVEDQAKEILAGAEKALQDLKDLTPKDMEAFEKVMTAWRLQAETKEEKAAKEAAMAQATRYATQIPLEIATVCLEVVRLANSLAPIGNKTAISDVGVGALVAEAALKSALLSVDINLPALPESEFKSEVLEKKKTLIAEGGKLREHCLQTVGDRL